MKFLEESNFDWMEMLNFYERPFRAKFIPAKVWKDLDRYKNDQEGLCHYMRKWRTRIMFVPPPAKSKLWQKYVAVGGEYAPDERQITLHLYSNNFNKHDFTEETWISFKYRIIQTMMHELIHFMQYDRRQDEWSNYVVPYKKINNTKKDAERKYLSEFDEIQAYAHCVYLDFKCKKPNVSINTLLKRCKKHRDSKTLHYFLNTFNYDFRNNASPRKLIDQIGKWERKYSRRT